ncbi:MAG TPA: hypothetical protein VN861_03185 [Candidatus Acidoferrales bacterium]|nr:hypothetical protein [Candidatus Acidoferrales bacterium]
MAKTLSEELLALIADDPAATARVKAAFASKPELIARDLKGSELIDIWSNFGGELETPAVTTPAVVHTPALPSSASTSAAATVPVTTNTNDAGGYAAILAKLDGIQTGIDAKISERLKNVVTEDKLPAYRSELLTLAIKSADDYASVRESHREEFKEPLDRTAFEKFVADSTAANIKFPSMKAAHDTFVAEKRTAAQATAKKAEIDAAVAEALKQQRSSTSVPGQTVTAGMSPAAQVIAKAKAAKANNGGESNAMRVARLLEAQDRAQQDMIQ